MIFIWEKGRRSGSAILFVMNDKESGMPCHGESNVMKRRTFGRETIGRLLCELHTNKKNGARINESLSAGYYSLAENMRRSWRRDSGHEEIEEKGKIEEEDWRRVLVRQGMLQSQASEGTDATSRKHQDQHDMGKWIEDASQRRNTVLLWCGISEELLFESSEEEETKGKLRSVSLVLPDILLILWRDSASLILVKQEHQRKE